jgi:16S rRNA (guanine1207-N2)-methyltransferase
MSDDSLKTLFHPFEAGLIASPPAGKRVLFLNAEPRFRLPDGFAASFRLQQDFRPLFLALESGDHAVGPEAEGSDYDMALVLCSRHRGRNELWIAEALRRVRAGGIVVVGGGKTDGAASLRKRIQELLPLDGHGSKNHGVVFWLTRPSGLRVVVEALEGANPPAIVDAEFAAAPGMFSHDRVDPGSRLLAENLPANLKGAAADFGAGWGYLSVKLARRGPDVASIDLYEASHAACEAARANMARLAPDMETRIHWHDLLSETVDRRYNVVVMNPPFHQGRATEPMIGAKMVGAASRALRPGGRLFLVANRQLPYEAALEAGFSRHGELSRDERYKVLWASR